VSVEQGFAAVRPRRWLAAVTTAVLTAGLGAILAIALPATARASAPASAGQQIAAALRTSPVYVDPSLSSAFPAAVRASLLQQIRKAPAPVFVLAVPLVAGGQWPSGGQLATVVQNYLGRAGIYLTIDATFSSDIDAYTWPSDPQGLDAAPYHAGDAAQAANLSQDMQNATLPQKFIEAIELIRDGQAVSAYQAAVRQLNANTPGQPSAQPAAHSGGSGPGPVLIALIVLVVIAAGGGAPPPQAVAVRRAARGLLRGPHRHRGRAARAGPAAGHRARRASRGTGAPGGRRPDVRAGPGPAWPGP